ncbi:hypothetical protein [Jidongwangia harbinensis]|uniref:hypothetical protein n=1 Tax=Jidongwangia harbinensis TaxID=2878561 RepID=UPI001CD93B9F|nr:hypothetical protein [Jidongwangia harbinensis]MCA2215777.1 hypothetical protein [Jidongwangia harbinensis]
MAERPVQWPAAEPPPPGWLPASGDQAAPVSGPMPPARPAHPIYREPHPVTAAPLLAGIGATALWFALFGAIGRDLFSYAWWTVVAAVSAWVVAAVLTVLGDRGVAVGVAVTSGVGLSVAGGFVAFRWITTSDWPMW